MKYKYWELLYEIPDGWLVDKNAGSPYPKSVFITNGKSVLNGQKRAILILNDTNNNENSVVRVSQTSLINDKNKVTVIQTSLFDKD